MTEQSPELLPAEKEQMVDALAIVELLEAAKLRKPRLAHDFDRIIADLRAEIAGGANA